jgi:sulfur carrier protein
MEILLNDTPVILASPLLSLVIDSYCVGKTAGVAVAVNHQVIPKSQWANTELKEHDQVIIIRATQGG